MLLIKVCLAYSLTVILSKEGKCLVPLRQHLAFRFVKRNQTNEWNSANRIIGLKASLHTFSKSHTSLERMEELSNHTVWVLHAWRKPRAAHIADRGDRFICGSASSTDLHSNSRSLRSKPYTTSIIDTDLPKSAVKSRPDPEPRPRFRPVSIPSSSTDKNRTQIPGLGPNPECKQPDAQFWAQDLQKH